MTSVLRQMAARPSTLTRATEPAEAVRHWSAITATITAAARAAVAHNHRRPRPHHAASTSVSTTTAAAAERVRVSATNTTSRAIASAAHERSRLEPVIHTRPSGSTPTANWAAMFLFANVAEGGKACGTKVQPHTAWPIPSTAMTAPAARAAAATGRRSSPRSARWKRSA